MGGFLLINWVTLNESLHLCQSQFSLLSATGNIILSICLRTPFGGQLVDVLQTF